MAIIDAIVVVALLVLVLVLVLAAGNVENCADEEHGKGEPQKRRDCLSFAAALWEVCAQPDDCVAKCVCERTAVYDVVVGCVVAWAAVRLSAAGSDV